MPDERVRLGQDGRRAVASDGLVATDDPAAADVILFNTCSVREKAQEKVFSDLGRVKHLKQSNPNLLIGVGGCVASQEGAAIVERAPYVDLVFGPQTLHRLPELIRRRRESGRSQVDISFPEIEKFDHLPPPCVDGASAFVSIMEGCSKYCSFCVVPYTRGEEVVTAARRRADRSGRLAARGLKEVTLLGQNVNAYKFEDISTLPRARTRQRDPRTRAHSLYDVAPKEFTPRLIDAYARYRSCEPCSLAGAIRQRPSARRDEARLHGAEYNRSCAGCAKCDRIFRSPRLHRRFPGEASRISTRRCT